MANNMEVLEAKFQELEKQYNALHKACYADKVIDKEEQQALSRASAALQKAFRCL